MRDDREALTASADQHWREIAKLQKNPPSDEQELAVIDHLREIARTYGHLGLLEKPRRIRDIR